jgi:phage tail-like protein
MTQQRSVGKDALLGHRFALEIAGIEQASFQECTGLQIQTEVFEYKEGGLNSYSHRLPGRTTYTNVTLKWGSTDSPDLLDWYNSLIAAEKKADEKRHVSIIQYDEKPSEMRRWNLKFAYPVKWVGPSFNAATSALSIETLELAFSEFEFKPGKA